MSYALHMDGILSILSEMERIVILLHKGQTNVIGALLLIGLSRLQIPVSYGTG